MFAEWKLEKLDAISTLYDVTMLFRLFLLDIVLQ
jgi:hypothetical protein